MKHFFNNNYRAFLFFGVGCCSLAFLLPAGIGHQTEPSGRQFLESFVQDVLAFCRMEEVSFHAGDSHRDSYEEFSENVRAGSKQIADIAHSASEHFSDTSMLQDDFARIAYPVFQKMVASTWNRGEEVVSDPFSIVSVSRRLTDGLELQSFLLTPRADFSPSPFSITIAKRGGRWHFFGGGLSPSKISSLESSGISSEGLLGVNMRWVPMTDPASLVVGRTQLSSVDFSWLGQTARTVVTWKGRVFGTPQADKLTGCSPEQVSALVSDKFQPFGIEALLLCDGGIPLSYIRQIAEGLEGKAWSVHILVPGVAVDEAYNVPVVFDASSPVDRGDDTAFVSERMFRLNPDARVRIQLTGQTDANVFSELIPYILSVVGD